MLTFEACPECGDIDVSASTNPHDISEIEYFCRNCGADWVEWDN